MVGNSVILGKRVINGQERDIGLSPASRAEHVYVPGANGSGKSKFLENMIRQDIENWRESGSGLLLLDPHGNLYHDVMKWVAGNPHLNRPIVPIDLTQKDWIIPYNLLRKREGMDVGVVVDSIVQSIVHVWGDVDVSSTPRIGRWMRNALRALYENGLPLSELSTFLSFYEREFREALTDQMARKDAQEELRLLNAQSGRDFNELVEGLINRSKPFLENGLFTIIFGQSETSLDLNKAVEDGAIILVNLAGEGGNLSEEDGRLFGTLLLSDLWQTMRVRGKRSGGSVKPVKPFYTYIDEFQEFITPTIAKNLAQARGFGLHLTLANQYPTQFLADEKNGKSLMDEIMGNARTKVVFAVEEMASQEMLARWLFLGRIDVDKVKDEIHQMMVVGVEERWVTETSSSSSESSGISEVHGSSSGESHSHEWDDSIFRDFKDDPSGMSSGESESSTHAESSGTTFSQTTSERMYQTPVYEEKLTSRAFYTPEEQMIQFRQIIANQSKGCAIFRCSSSESPNKNPIPIAAIWIEEEPYSPAFVHRMIVRLYESLSFALPYEEAFRLSEVTKARALALKEPPAKALPEEEPKEFKRRIRRPKNE